MLITIASATHKDWSLDPSIPVELRVFALKPYIAADGIPVSASPASPGTRARLTWSAGAACIVTAPQAQATLANPSPNIYDKTAVVSGAYDIQSKTIDAASGYETTGFMALNGATSIVANTILGGAGNEYQVAFFDQNKTQLNVYSNSLGPGTVAANTPITVPSGAVYCRTVYPTGNTPDASIMIVGGNTLPAAYQPFTSVPLTEATNTQDIDGGLVTPAITLESTLDAIQGAGATLCAMLFRTDTGASLGVYGIFASFVLPASPTSVTWAQIAAAQPSAAATVASGGSTTGTGTSGGSTVSATVSPNIYNPAAVVSGAYNIQSKTIDAANGYETTDFMVVSGATSIISNVPLGGAGNQYQVAFFDQNKTQLNVYSNSLGPGTVAANTPIAVPSGAAYCRTVYQTGNKPDSAIEIVLGTTLPASYTAYGTTSTSVGGVVISAASVSPWNGKKLAVWGDSISSIFQNQWQASVISATGLSLVYQDARPGRTIGGIFEAYGASNGQAPGVNVGSYTNNLGTFKNTDALTVSTFPADGGAGGTQGYSLTQDLAATAPDLGLVFLGMNDTGGTAIGSPTDSATSGTIYGNVLNALQQLQTAAPTMRIIWITPYINAVYNVDPNLTNVIGAIQYWCGKYGVPCIDMATVSGINSLNWLIYLQNDGNNERVHPTTLGFSARVGPAIGRALNGL